MKFDDDWPDKPEDASNGDVIYKVDDHGRDRPVPWYRWAVEGDEWPCAATHSVSPRGSVDDPWVVCDDCGREFDAIDEELEYDDSDRQYDEWKDRMMEEGRL